MRPPGFQPAAAAAADVLPAAPDGQQADEGEEEARPRVLKAPHEPSQREIVEHEAMGHATYRSWCRVCIAAKGQGQPHLRAPEDDETAVPVVSSDYAFMGQDDADTMPMLVLRDRRSKMMAATFVEKKGDDAYAIKFFARFLRILGYRKIVNKSDGEPAILLVKRRAVEEVPGLEAIPQESAPADHQANGEIEVTVREIKKQVRALKMDLESKLGVKVEDKHPVLAHLPEHAASVINRYRRGQDGKTALQRLTGRQWRKPVPLFGERLMVRFAGERARKNALEEQMVEARYIGHHPRDGSMMVITSDGVKKAVGFRSLPQSEKWITAGWDSLKGLPWDVAPRAASAPRAIVGPGEAGPPPIVVVPPQPQAPRRMYVLKADVERLGATPGCPGCVSIAKHGKVLAGHAHNAVCSKRIFEALDAEEAGRERTGQYRERRQGQEARVRPAAAAAAGTPPPKTARRITEPVAAAASAPAASRSAAAPAAAARMRESQPGASGSGVAAPSGGASSSSGAVRAAEAAEDVDMTATRSRLKRLAEVAPDDVPEALERGDPQPADVPVPVDMEDLAAQPAPAEGPQLPAGVAVVWNASEGRHMRVLALDVASIELVELGVLTRAKAELLPLVREQVSGHWASVGVDIADEEVDSIALSALQLGAVDVAEVYSPHRFSARAAEFQLRPGFAADLEELKEDGAPWDLRRPEDVKELEEQQERMDPILLTGSPPCEKFSLLRGLSAKFRTDEQEAAEMEEARHHLKVAVDAYWRQLRKPGRYFLHEHPWSARSWNEDIVKELVAHPGVFTVKGPMCRWGMKLTNPRSGQEEFVRKETGWVTNHPGLARRLQGTCSNVDGRAEWHRHITLVGGIARFAKVYPPKLVEAVLEELKDTLNDVGELSTAQVQQSGPVPVDAAVPPGDWTSYWDDVNGGYLEAGLVAQARAVEREWVKKQELIEIESLRRKGRKPGNFKIGFFDISRAHFYGKAQRRIFVELEEESRKEYGEDKCGLLLKSWYGTQDASKIWQGDYTELLEEHGYKAGVSCPAVFYKEVDETRLLGHGDDFAVLAQQQDIDSFEATLGKKYEFKKTANLGFDEGDDKQAVFLNRVIEVSAGVPPGGGRPCRHAMIEPDKRRAEIVIDELGLSKANGVDTPMEKRSADKQMMDAKSAALGTAEAPRFRSLTMRVAYLSQDRLDLAEASKTLARSMQTPTEASWLMLKRVGRYLKRHPSTVTVFTEQKMFDKIRVYVDSDHAGCAVTRKSTGGFVAMLGHHVIKHGSNLQSTVSLSSGESEYYALVKGGSVGLGLHSLFADWGLDLKVELASDSSAARGHVQRRGLGKMRHVQSRYLWIQERVGKGDLSIAAVPGKNNVADVLTKSVDGRVGLDAPACDVEMGVSAWYTLRFLAAAVTSTGAEAAAHGTRAGVARGRIGSMQLLEEVGDAPKAEDSSEVLLPPKADACSNATSNCWDTKCCKDDGLTCFAQDLGWAQCNASCEEGAVWSSADPNYVQTKWSCARVVTHLSAGAATRQLDVPARSAKPPAQPRGEQCAVEGEYCGRRPCCEGSGTKCFKKNAMWASCRNECTPGIDKNDPKWARTPWSCEELAPPIDVVGEETLFCFALMLPDSYEVGLIQTQLDAQAGIFGCDASAVYSNQSIKMSSKVSKASLKTQVVPGSLHCELGGQYWTALNTEIFVRVWKKVASGKEFGAHGWTVKADPDAVILPRRLRLRAGRSRFLSGRQDKVYMNNCQFGLHGPVEMMSLGAMVAYRDGIDRCVEELKEEFSQYGEDVFLRECLQLVGVDKVEDFSMMKETHCDWYGEVDQDTRPAGGSRAG
ncbi:unnamed protein product [Prorocentrum cordatum]|uniref:Integrase catalytic domain-containing protein n=1 Tax=Prorocentrum cordatum TaxID=2364126 RepID=A0ABN9UZK8_9DINO|nr:unnamed protein product [Polarella glacialis]